jgi:hypothetical protein
MPDRSSRTGLVIVVAVIAVGVIGLAAWLLWWRPRQERATDQASVRAWEERWLPARRCLLGDRPLAADAADALALAELATGSLAAKTSDCTGQVKTITRPEGEMASDRVERAFLEVEAAIPAVAQAYAFRISATDHEIDRRVGELGVAITALDAAHHRLRAAAGLPAPRPDDGLRLHLLGEPRPLALDGAPLTAALAHQPMGGAIRDRPRDRGGLLNAELYGALVVRFAMTGPDAVKQVRAPAGATPALPDGSWMVTDLPARALDLRALPDDVVAVALPVADEIDHAAAVPLAPWRQAYAPVAALGRGDTRSVVLTPDPRPDRPLPAGAPGFVLATSSDGGRTWALGPQVAGHLLRADLDVLTGTVDVVVSDEPFVLSRPHQLVPTRWYRLDGEAPAVLPEPLEVPGLELQEACRRGRAVWAHHAAGQVIGVLGDEVVLLEAPAGVDRVLDCTGDAALLEEGSMPVQYHRCTRDGCALAFRGATYAYGRAALREDDRVVYAAGRGHVLALWTEGVPEPTYFKLPRPMTLHALVVWDGVPHALVHAVRDPARALFAVPLSGS